MKKLRITVEGKTYDVEVEVLGGKIASVAPAAAPVAAPAPVAAAPVAAAPVAPAAPAPAPVAAAGADDVVSPLSAVVVSVDTTVGAQVKEGDKLLTLEAMKMNTFVNSPKSGTVAKIYVAAGQSVEEGRPLISIS